MHRHSDCFDDEAETVVSALDFDDRTELDPSFGCRSPKTLPANAFTAVMPKDLDEHEAPKKPLARVSLHNRPQPPLRKPLPREHGIPSIAYADTVQGLKPLPWKPSPQALIPTQIFGSDTRAKRLRVLPPPPTAAPRMPSYGWIDALIGLFRRSA